MGSRLEGEAVEKAREFCRDEYKDYLIYRRLAEYERDPRLREILVRLSEEEYEHYLFWSRLIGEDCKSSVSPWTIRLLRLSRRLLGLTFTLKFLELHEKDVIEEYKRYLDNLSGEDREILERIIEDEETHESKLMSSINEAIVRYLSFVALGLADAIVEITGVHAGFLGATKETLVAGIAGLIVGVSAAFSMAGAAYLQAKAEAVEDVLERTPGRSALVTGLSYIFSVVMLALPYFLTKHMAYAFAVSVVMAVGIVAGFTFYNSVLNESSFRRELAENLAILFGTAIVAYLFGDVIGRVFGLEHIL